MRENNSQFTVMRKSKEHALIFVICMLPKSYQSLITSFVGLYILGKSTSYFIEHKIFWNQAIFSKISWIREISWKQKFSSMNSSSVFLLFCFCYVFSASIQNIENINSWQTRHKISECHSKRFFNCYTSWNLTKFTKLKQWQLNILYKSHKRHIFIQSITVIERVPCKNVAPPSKNAVSANIKHRVIFNCYTSWNLTKFTKLKSWQLKILYKSRKRHIFIQSITVIERVNPKTTHIKVSTCNS